MDKNLYAIYAVFSFLFGTCIASFLNVAIYRLPRGESIVSPPSRCPKCGAPIRWWQNIPVLSYLALRGRCANCKTRISPRYLVVELLGGALFLAAFFNVMSAEQVMSVTQFHAGRIFVLAMWWIWISLMIVGSFIDFDHQLIPDFVTIGGMVLGIVFWTGVSMCFKMFHPDFNGRVPFIMLAWSLSGLALGFGLLWLIRFLGTLVFKREAMGMGDVFLMGAVGALFGPIAVVFTLVFSSLLGSVAGVAMILASKAKLGGFVAIPFGPYIAAASLAWMFGGEELVALYLRLLGLA